MSVRRARSESSQPAVEPGERADDPADEDGEHVVSTPTLTEARAPWMTRE